MSDGIELYVERSGEGIPCVYLHGGPGYWSKSFQECAGEFLGKHLEMIYIDQRGCGRSSHDKQGNYSLERLIEDIEEVRMKLNINKWYVMGHSFGGILAVNYARKCPERVVGLILCNATLNMRESLSHQIETGINILEIDEVETPSENLVGLHQSIVGKLMEKGLYFTFQFMDIENKKILDELDNDLNTDPLFQRSIFASGEYFQDFTLDTSHVSVPVLVIAGEYDDAIGPKHHTAFAFRNSTISLLQSGHHPYIENKKEFEEVILDFIY